MNRGQRKAHLRVWTVLAIVLPGALAVILALAAGQVVERAPRLLEPPVTGGAAG